MAERTKVFLNRDGKAVWIGLAGLLFLIFALLFASFRGARSSPFTFSQEHPLSCREIYQIGTWSSKRYGGRTKLAIRSHTFAKEFAEVFLEKMDPFHVLWTEKEANLLSARITTAFRRLVNEYRCSDFDKLFKEELPKAKASLQIRLKRLGTTKLRETPLPTNSSNQVEMFGVKFAKFPDRASEESELSTRLLSLVNRIDRTYNKTMARAYRHDHGRFISESMEQLLFSETKVNRNLIVKSMLGALDPYSTYFSNTEFEDFYHELTGATLGIGVTLRKVPSGLFIEKITQGSPAERSHKLQVGDIILAIDGKDVSSLSFEEAKQKLKGPEKSLAHLKIEKGADGKKWTVAIPRESFSLEEARITYHLLSPKTNSEMRVAVIDIPSFYGRGGMDPVEQERSSAEDLTLILRKLLKSHRPPAAIVLDLRGNPGGYLEEAVASAGLFLGQKPVVGVVEHFSRRTLQDSRKSPLYTGPLVVLQDEETASASEVLAGALKDHQRAIVVGSAHSFGKGSVQRLFHLSDEWLFEKGFGENVPGVVKLTTSIFYSPLGHSPANGGVTSDIPLPEPLVPSLKDIPASNTSPAKHVPETEPFVASSYLALLEKSKTKVKQRIAALEDKSHYRLNSYDDMTERAKKVMEKELFQPEQMALEEAVSLAADSALLERTSPSLEVSATAKAE